MAAHHPPDIKATAVAMLIGGVDVASVAKQCAVPRQTVQRWAASIGPDGGVETGANGRPAWMPKRGACNAEELQALVGDYLYGQRVILAWLRQPEHLDHAEPDRIQAVVAAHDSLGSRVAGLAERLGASALQSPAPALSEGDPAAD